MISDLEKDILNHSSATGSRFEPSAGPAVIRQVYVLKGLNKYPDVASTHPTIFQTSPSVAS